MVVLGMKMDIILQKISYIAVAVTQLLARHKPIEYPPQTITVFIVIVMLLVGNTMTVLRKALILENHFAKIFLVGNMSTGKFKK